MHFFDNTSMKGQCKKRFLSSSQLIDSQVLINLILLKSTPPSMNFTSSALLLSLKQMYVHSEQSWLVMIFYFLIIFH